MTPLREEEEFVAREVLLKERIVLVGKFSIHATEAEILAPFQLSEQWYSIEYFSVKIHGDMPHGVAVV